MTKAELRKTYEQWKREEIEAVELIEAVARYLDDWSPSPSSLTVPAPQPCGIADPSTRDCENMKEVGGGMDGERYRCDVCGKGYFLDYEEMK